MIVKCQFKFISEIMANYGVHLHTVEVVNVHILFCNVLSVVTDCN